METKQPFKILSKICLNNWHYIDQKILTFSEGINFFTGHSGSGKSTVIDAMQIVLYANTDGRGFFNKRQQMIPTVPSLNICVEWSTLTNTMNFSI